MDPALRKCANIKSKKHKDQPCSYTATHGDFCSRHYKNPTRFEKPVQQIPECIMTRNNVKKLILLQRVWRKWSAYSRYRRQGPAANNYDSAANPCELYSLDPLSTIPRSFFFSFADHNKNIWAFDIRTLSHLVSQSSEIVNPYTRAILDSAILQKIHSRILWLRQRKYPIYFDTNENLTQNQLWNQKVLDVFFKMEALGYRASCTWFEEMNIEDHGTFYRRLHRLWHYQLGLTVQEREAIVPGCHHGMSKLFRHSPERIQSETHDLKWWRRANLNLILEFLTRSPHKSQQSLGALYVLMALVQVVPEASEAYPWVRESLGY